MSPDYPEENAAAEHAGRIAMITGGGRGFGLAFGHAFAQRGAHVVLIDVDRDAVEAAAADIAAGSATARVGDVTDEQQVAAIVDDVVRQHGGIDILVNNAGLHSQEFNEPMGTSGVAKLRRLFDVNVMGTIICTLAVAPHMRGRHGASIVNIASVASYSARTPYGVSKLAVRGLTVASAHELGPDGIRVNAIAPGLIFTDTIRRELPDTVVDAVQRQQILDQDGDERDIVDALLYLVSDRARFITGETLRVSGGFTLQV